MITSNALLITRSTKSKMNSYRKESWKISLLSLTLLIALLCLSVPSSFAASNFYSLNSYFDTTQLLEINPNDASVVSFVDLYMPDGSGYAGNNFALAFNPDNDLYGWDSTLGQLYNITSTSQTTAQVNYIGNPVNFSPTGSSQVTGLAFDNTGTLYGIAQNYLTQGSEALISIDTATNGVNLIGYLNEEIGTNGLAVDYNTGDLYLVSGDAYDKVMTLDENTGNATVIGQLGTTARAVGAEFLPGTMTLYSVRNGSELWSYDLNDGSLTYGLSSFVGQIGGQGGNISVASLAAQWPAPPVVPEPISSILFLTGGAVMAGRNYLRKKRSNS